MFFKKRKLYIYVFRQELQRLQSDEREFERDLERYNRDLARPSYSSLLEHPQLSDPNKEFFRSQTPRWSLTSDNNSPIPTERRTRIIIGHTLSMNTPRTSVDRFTPISPKRLSINRISSFNTKSPLISRRINSTTSNIRPSFQQHADSINQQKREIEQKLKEFLN